MNLRLEKARSRTETDIAPDRTVVSLLEKAPNGKNTSLNAQTKGGNNASSARESEPPSTKQRGEADQKPNEESDPLKTWKKSWRVSNNRIH